MLRRLAQGLRACPAAWGGLRKRRICGSGGFGLAWGRDLRVWLPWLAGKAEIEAS